MIKQYQQAVEKKEELIKIANELLEDKKHDFFDDEKRKNKYIFMLFIVADEKLKAKFRAKFLDSITQEKIQNQSGDNKILIAEYHKEAKDDPKYEDQSIHFDPMKAFERCKYMYTKENTYMHIGIPYDTKEKKKRGYGIILDSIIDAELFEAFGGEKKDFFNI